MNQSEKIREIVLDILKNDENETMGLKDRVEINGKSMYGVKYSTLKNYLLNLERYNFSEGAVTGALQTVTKRVDNIHKQKTKQGVYFFYFDDKKITGINTVGVNITESDDYKELEEKVKDVNNHVSEILRNASKGKYKDSSNMDLDNLRSLLKISDQLDYTLKKYKNDKTFESIESQINNFNHIDF